MVSPKLKIKWTLQFDVAANQTMLLNRAVLLHSFVPKLREDLVKDDICTWQLQLLICTGGELLFLNPSLATVESLGELILFLVELVVSSLDVLALRCR